MADLLQTEENINYRDLSYLEYLRESADFDSQISFAQRILREYDWPHNVKADFKRQLERIISKHKDETLNLTVVGEFGTGKSTLINSLIRIEDFLVSSALQGTTVAATIIEYADRYGITLEYMDGRAAHYGFKTITEVRESLISFTTDEAVAKGLSNVRIKLPASQLGLGFRIIDTPGTNSNERWHEDVTVRTINELSDLVILIIDANKPLSESFSQFVKINLSQMMNQCVFLVTRMDMVRKRERAGILDYLRQKISVDFDIESPVVLPYAALDVMEDSKGEECTLLAEASYETEDKLLYFMKQQKTMAQTKKLVALIDSMYMLISQQMGELSQGYTDELAFLNRSRQTALEPFVMEQKTHRTESYRKTASQKRSAIVSEYEGMAAAAYNKVMGEIDGVSNLDNLKSFSENRLSDLCINEAQSIIDKSKTLNQTVCGWFSSEMQSFRAAFEKLFEDLEILKIDFENKLLVIPEMPPVQVADLAQTSRYISKQLSKENRGYAGKAAAGAAIGTAIAPGVGTVIGGVVGFLFGSPNSAKIQAAIEGTKETLSTPLKSYFSDVVLRVVKNLDLYIGQIENCICAEIDRYLVTYREAVSEKIALEEKKISQVEQKLRTIRIDMEHIDKRKQLLNSLNRQLDSLSGKEG